MKISDKISKINKYIENIKEWQWLLITFIICLIFMVSIRPEILWAPYIHAEDGTEFLKDALYEGPKSLLNIFGGYLGVLPRLFAVTAIYFGKKFNSMIVVAFVMKTCATLFSVFSVNYFNSKELKGIINSRILRLIISVLLLYVMANHKYMVYTSIMTHWWGGLLCFMVGFSFLNKRMPPLYIVPFVVLTILSSPSSLVIIVPMAYYAFYKLRDSWKKDGIEIISKNKLKATSFIFIALSIIIEAFVILFMAKSIENMDISGLSINNILHTIFKTTKCMLQCIPNILTLGKWTEIFNLKGQIILGNIILIFIYYKYYKNKDTKIFLWSIFTIFTIYFMEEFKRKTNTVLPSMHFYNAIPSAISIMLVVKLIYEEFKKLYKNNEKILKVVMSIFLIFAIFIYSHHTYKLKFEFCNNLYKIEQAVDFSSDEIIKVVISPSPNWTVPVPVS